MNRDVVAALLGLDGKYKVLATGDTVDMRAQMPPIRNQGHMDPDAPQNPEPRFSSTTRLVVWTLVGVGGFVAIIVISGAIFLIVTMMNRSSKPRAR